MQEVQRITNAGGLPFDSLAGKFSSLIDLNLVMGYRLESWQLTSQTLYVQDTEPVVVETIIAVFQRMEQ